MNLLDKLFGKNQLDEMQEQKLRLIESRGFWLTWCALLAAMAVQSLMGAAAREMAGEWFVFMAVNIYVLEECLRNGIWDRRLKADHATNLVCSLAAGVGMVVFIWAQSRFWLGAILTGAFTFLLCLGMLELFSALYKRRHRKLEQDWPEGEPKEEEK